MGLASDGEPVLVTGGGGLIGSALIKALVDAGHQVTSTFRDGPSESLPRSVEQMPLTPESLHAALGATGTLIHLAARTGGIEFQRREPLDLFFTNRNLTDLVLQAVAEHGTPRLIVASSAAVYAPSTQPLSEDSPNINLDQTESAYAAAKLVDEISASWVGKSGTTTVVITRIGNVYGERGRFDALQSSVVHGLIGRSIEARDTGRLVAWGSPDTVRSFVHVDDVAAAIAFLATIDAPDPVYNVDSGVAVTIERLAEIIAGQAAPGTTVWFDESRPRGEPFRVLSIERLRARGFEPRIGLEAGIRRTLDAFLTRLEH